MRVVCVPVECVNVGEHTVCIPLTESALLYCSYDRHTRSHTGPCCSQSMHTFSRAFAYTKWENWSKLTFVYPHTHTRTHTEKLKTGLRFHCCWNPHLSDLVSLSHCNTHYLTTFCVTFDLPCSTLGATWTCNHSWQDRPPQRVWDVSEGVSDSISELGEEHHNMGISYVLELNIDSKGTANNTVCIIFCLASLQAHVAHSFYLIALVNKHIMQPKLKQCLLCKLRS